MKKVEIGRDTKRLSINTNAEIVEELKSAAKAINEKEGRLYKKISISDISSFAIEVYINWLFIKQIAADYLEINDPIYFYVYNENGFLNKIPIAEFLLLGLITREEVTLFEQNITKEGIDYIEIIIEEESYQLRLSKV